MGRGSRAATIAALALAASAGSAIAADTVGSPGVGDPFFPLAGNGGIDVTNYSLDLAYDPQSRQLSGTATLSIRATQNLSRFDLDLRGFALGAVTVNGAVASVARDGQELMITPSHALRSGEAFTAVVPYAGQPQTVTTRTARARAGSTPLTARLSSESHRAPRPGIPPTTPLGTRRRSRSG
jgi:hypothetical protein